MAEQKPKTSASTGHISDGFDASDRTYYYRGPSIIPGPRVQHVNLWAEHRDFLSPIYNQGQTNSCVANATASAVRYLTHKIDNETHALSLPHAHNLSTNPSRLFLYYIARAVELMKDIKGGTYLPVGMVDNGATIRNAFKAMNLFGLATESKWQWREEGDPRVIIDINSRPPDDAFRNAMGSHAVEFCRLDPDHTDVAEALMNDEERLAIGVVTLFRMKQCLIEGFPVVFAFNFYWKNLQCHPADPSDPDSLQFPRLVEPVKGGKSTVSHAVLCVGFDEEKQAILIQNSYGDKEPDDYPHFWMGYDWIKSFEATEDFWMLRTLSAVPTVASHLTVQKITSLKLDDRWRLSRLPSLNRDLAMTLTSTVGSTSPDHESAEFFYISMEGQVDCASYSEGRGWKCVTLARAGSATPGAIAAVARNKDLRELFWASENGSVIYAFNLDTNSANIVNQSRWVSFILAGPGSVAPHAGMAALSRKDLSMHLEVWWVGTKGSIEGSYYSLDEKQWIPYTLVQGNIAWKNSCLAAISMFPEHMSVWWITENGRIQGRWWRVNTGWKQVPDWPFQVPGSVALESRIACVSPLPGSMYLYYITPSGQIEVMFWWGKKEVIYGEWGHDMVKAPRARVDSDIKAVSINPLRIDLFWIGQDNSLESAIGTMGSDYKQIYTPLTIAGPGSVMAGSPLGVFSRLPNSISLCFRNFDGELVIIDY